MTKNDKTVLITGASSGIGKKVALTLATEGYNVFAGIRRKADKIELESINKNIKGVYIDITNKSSIEKAFWYIYKNTKKIDVLINNAGIAIAGPIEYIPVEEIKSQFDVNTFGALAVTQKFMPLLKDGKIINISSMAACGIFPFISPYCASKRALDILFNSLYLENKDNIKIISVKPAAVRTPIWEKSVKKANNILRNIPEDNLKKYDKEITYLEKNALNNNKTGVGCEQIAKVILQIVKSKNPKSSYNIGFDSIMADFISKLPDSIINLIVKIKLKMIK
ncbi:MAG: SDR family oxidoreductase [Candidatus Gastranaerophilales bacterium]|nr:SDR family oxidoreductase [Candidatus Gastranaerophilales bacterium]